MFDLGVPELLVVLLVVLVIFGPGRLPEIGGALGRSLREFREATSDQPKKVAMVESDQERDQNKT